MRKQSIKVDLSSLRATETHLTAFITGGRGARLILGFAKKLEKDRSAVLTRPDARGIRHVVGQRKQTDMPAVIEDLTNGELVLEIIDLEDDDCFLRTAHASEPEETSQ